MSKHATAHFEVYKKNPLLGKLDSFIYEAYHARDLEHVEVVSYIEEKFNMVDYCGMSLTWDLVKIRLPFISICIKEGYTYNHNYYHINSDLVCEVSDDIVLFLKNADNLQTQANIFSAFKKNKEALEKALDRALKFGEIAKVEIDLKTFYSYIEDKY